MVSLDGGRKNKRHSNCAIVACLNLQRELPEAMKQKIRAGYEAIGGSPDKPLKSNYFLNIMIAVAALAILISLLGNFFFLGGVFVDTPISIGIFELQMSQMIWR